jgi:reversibly glycosylated polypeptide/UDP-arabinopyranose mutase
MEITVIVPTIRSECYKRFAKEWEEMYRKHNFQIVVVEDGDKPLVDGKFGAKNIMGKYSDLIYNKSDVVRNLGFIYAKKEYDPDIYITLDDDVTPLGNTIQDHIDALSMTFPKHWMSTASEYVRGIPYNVRKERECVVSHGVWEGVYDYDAPTQLVRGNPKVDFYKGAVPHGVYFPLCGMNLAFKEHMLPYMYLAPMGHKVGIDRFGDIWLGIELKKVCDKNNWAIATGYAKVFHDKASNVYKNLQKEAKGLEMNDFYGKDPYFKLYKEKRKRWEEYVNSL